MKLLIIAIIVFLSSQAFGLDLTAEDKIKHVGVSLILSGGTYVLLREMGYSVGGAAAGSFMAALTIGHLKETSDVRYDSEDMAANALGVIAGLGISVDF